MSVLTLSNTSSDSHSTAIPIPHPLTVTAPTPHSRSRANTTNHNNITRTPTYTSSQDPFNLLLAGATDLFAPALISDPIEAKKRSDQIDAAIKEEAKNLKTRYRLRIISPSSSHSRSSSSPPSKPKPKLSLSSQPTTASTTHNGPAIFTLLLLGQAESGKTTLQKQFQILYARESLSYAKNMEFWKCVVYLNVVRAVGVLLDGVRELGASGASRSRGKGELEGLAMRIGPIVLMEEALGEAVKGPSQINLNLSMHANPNTASAGGKRPKYFCRREWQYRPAPPPAASTSSTSTITSPVAGPSHPTAPSSSPPNPSPASPDPNPSDPTTTTTTSQSQAEIDALLSARKQTTTLSQTERLLYACGSDITALWNEEGVRRAVKVGEVVLEEWEEYFLQNIPRIAALEYVPSTSDILHARLQTIGVSEHQFEVPAPSSFSSLASSSSHSNSQLSDKSRKEKERENMWIWHVIDVGGARGERMKWDRFFDGANAIVFFAPLSAFDQTLEEEQKTNRMRDSMDTFQKVCGNKLLRRVNMVLFLNKSDILRKKLAAGIQVKNHVTNYKKANTYEEVVKYFSKVFEKIHDDAKRSETVLYTHVTNMIDTEATGRIIDNVRESINRDWLKDVSLV